MVTNTQHIEAEARTFGNMKKKGLLSGKKPIAVLIFFALALSMAFPYGVGIAVLAWGIALLGALFGVGFASYVLLKDLLSKTSTFGYSPTAAYLAGKKTKKRAKEEDSDQDTKNNG